MLYYSSIAGGQPAWALRKANKMSLSGWIMMIVVLGGVWGGFVYMLLETIKQKQD